MDRMFGELLSDVRDAPQAGPLGTALLPSLRARLERAETVDADVDGDMAKRFDG